MVNLTETLENVVRLVTLALYALAPRLQTPLDLGLISQIANASSTVLLVIGIWAFQRGDILPKGAVERLIAGITEGLLKQIANLEKELARAQEHFQARLDANSKHYEIRLAEKDQQIAARELQLEKERESHAQEVKEMTLMLSQAAALVNSSQHKAA